MFHIIMSIAFVLIAGLVYMPNNLQAQSKQTSPSDTAVSRTNQVEISVNSESLRTGKQTDGGRVLTEIPITMGFSKRQSKIVSIDDDDKKGQTASKNKFRQLSRPLGVTRQHMKKIISQSLLNTRGR